MSNRAKVILLKIVIVTSFIWLMVSTVGAIIMSILLDGVVSESTFRALITAVMIITLAHGAVFFYMTCFVKIEITPDKVKAARHHLSVNTYDEVKDILVAAFTENGFSEPVNVENDYADCVMLLTKKGSDKFMVLELVRVHELTDEILDKCTDDFWDYVCSKNMQSRDVFLMQCICVDRITKTFSTFTDSNVEQGYKQYRLPIGISFGGKTVYIATQKGGLFKVRYNHLKKQFMTLAKNLIIPEETAE